MEKTCSGMSSAGGCDDQEADTYLQEARQKASEKV